MKKFRINKKIAIGGIIVSLLLAFLPDPTDVLDAGTPVVEIIVSLILYYFGVKK